MTVINLESCYRKIEDDGYVVIDDFFPLVIIDRLVSEIENSIHQNSNFRKDGDLFAIRNFLGEVPSSNKFIWNEEFNFIIDRLFGEDYFNVKSIYFNKPPLSNWLVTWHQDTTISVDSRKDIPGFGPWTLKQGLHAVQPTQEYLENLFTIRIHLDDCDETNGALKVIPGSHKSGMLKDDSILKMEKNIALCEVKKGGIMIMKPLLVHSSSKSTSNKNRRVIHLEFSSLELPMNLKWREKINRTPLNDLYLS